MSAHQVMKQASLKLELSCTMTSFNGGHTSWTTIRSFTVTFPSQILLNLRMTVYNYLWHSWQLNKMTLASPVWLLSNTIFVKAKLMMLCMPYVKRSKLSTIILHSKKQMSLGNKPTLEPNHFSNLSQRTKFPLLINTGVLMQHF